MKAHKIGLPTFEASVSCGAYCQGGSVNMQPTTYPEFTDADEVWVKGEDAAKLAAENATLRSTIDDLTAGEIHTCHDHCQRTACILRRENTALRSRLAEAETQNRVMWDVANDREARLAEVDRLREELKLRECEGPAHVCHNLATERAEVRRLREWQRRAVQVLRVMVGEIEGKGLPAFEAPLRALIEEAGRE